MTKSSFCHTCNMRIRFRNHGCFICTFVAATLCAVVKLRTLNVTRCFGVFQEAERVQTQLFWQPWQDGPVLCSSPGQHHSNDGAASVESRKTVLLHVRWCCPPLPQFDRCPRLGAWRHPHGSWQVCKLAVGSKRSCELLDDVVGRPHPCDGCGW